MFSITSHKVAGTRHWLDCDQEPSLRLKREHFKCSKCILCLDILTFFRCGRGNAGCEVLDQNTEVKFRN